MEEINYERLIPAEPQEDVVRFAYESGKFRKQYLIYQADRVYEPLEDRNKEAVKVVCSACGETFFADKIKAGGCIHSYVPAPFGWRHHLAENDVISGDHTFCPYCGKEAETVHIGSMRLYGGEMVDDAWVSTLSRLPVEGQRDRLVLSDWCVRRCINKRGETRHEIWPYTAWVVEERKIVRLMGYMKTMSGAISLFGKWQQRKTFCDVYGKADLLMPWDKSLLEGTTAENCKLDLYQAAGGNHPVSYLALWRKRPAVENLLVQGCGKLVTDWISEETEGSCGTRGIPKLNAVNWKEKRPAQMLWLTKAEFRQMRQNSFDPETMKKIALVRKHKIELQIPEDLDILRRFSVYTLREILTEDIGADFWKILRYLHDPKRTWYALRDYWRVTAELGRDMTDSQVRWPRDLNAAHDRAVKECKHQKDALLAAAFQKRAEELAALSFRLDGMLIRPCRDQAELIAEGNALHHCVASYAQNHAGGKTAILFIRRADKPEEPFFTLEFDEKNLVIRQNRGLRNCGRTPEVEAFEKAWLEWVKAGMKKKVRVKVA